MNFAGLLSLEPKKFARALLFTLLCYGSSTAQVSAETEITPLGLPALDQSNPLVLQVITETYQVVLAEPKSAQTWGEYGMALAANGFMDDSVVALENAHRLEPHELKWLQLLTSGLNSLSDDRDLLFTEKLETLGSRSADAKFTASLVYEAHGQLKQATTALKQALKAKPDQPALNYLLGQLLYTLKRYDESRNYLLKAMKALPTSARIRASLLKLSNHISIAPELIPEAKNAQDLREISYSPDLETEIIKKYSRQEKVLNYRVLESMRIRDWATAKQQFVWLDEYYQLPTAGRVMYGQTLEALGEYEAAEEQYRHLLHEDETNQQIRLALADLMFVVQKPEAERHYQWLLLNSDNNSIKAEALQGLGKLAARTGNLKGALKQLSAALAINSRSAAFHFDIVPVYAGLKRFSKARWHMQQAQSLGMTIPPNLKEMLDHAEQQDR